MAMVVAVLKEKQRQQLRRTHRAVAAKAAGCGSPKAVGLLGDTCPSFEGKKRYISLQHLYDFESRFYNRIAGKLCECWSTNQGQTNTCLPFFLTT